MSEAVQWIIGVLLLATSTGLLLTRAWLRQFALISLQYVGVAALIFNHWPVSMAAAKLITGWMAAAALAMTQQQLRDTNRVVDTSWPEGRLFRLLTAGVVAATALVSMPGLAQVFPGASRPEAFAGLILGGMGLLHLGITLQPQRVVLGLLTLLSGFEILYAPIDNSILVAALLSLVTLSLSITGAYLLLAGRQPST